MLDEIQRLVPGYDISRLGLLAGNDVHTQLVQITGATGVSDPKLILPANDTLFTSGTLGRFSATLNTVYERYNHRQMTREHPGPTRWCEWASSTRVLGIGCDVRGPSTPARKAAILRSE